MGNITFNILGLSIALLSFADKSHGLYFEHLLCENRQTKLNCTVGNSIDDINITIHGVTDACSTTDNVKKGKVITLDSTSYQSCIGNNSCVLNDEMFNVSHSVLDTKRKLVITFDCVRKSDHDHYRRPKISTSPFNMKLVNCTYHDRRIEIQSIELKEYLSYCKKQNFLNSSTKCIQMKVNASCNGNKICDQLTWNSCDDCSILPKFANISIICKAFPNGPPMQTESDVEGVAVGVTVGLIVIVGVVVAFRWFVRRRKPDDKQHNSSSPRKQ